MVKHDTATTGPDQIWSDVGPNWWVETSKPSAQRIQKVLSGRVVGGTYHSASH